jgi:hypothetical protein
LLFGGSAVLGRFAHWLVRFSKLDLRTQIFRFKNEWFYLLTGEALQFSEAKLPSRSVDGVYLSAVVDHGNETYLYRGIILDWSFNGEGDLESIRITDAHRRPFSKDRAVGQLTSRESYISGGPPDDRYYEIRGDLLVLRYSDIKTLNLDYFSLEEELRRENSPDSTTVTAETLAPNANANTLPTGLVDSSGHSPPEESSRQ